MNSRTWILCVTLASLPLAAPAMALEKGIRAGVELATISGDFGELVGFDHKAGVTAGPFVAIPLALSPLALQIEALYTMKGGKTSATIVDEAGTPTGTFTQFIDLTYIEVPVLLRLSPKTPWPLRPAVVAGPSFGMSLGGRIHGGGLDQSTNNLRGVDAGWTVGGGLRWRMFGAGATADARYTRSFESVWRVANSLEALNSAFSFTFGVEL